MIQSRLTFVFLWNEFGFFGNAAPESTSVQINWSTRTELYVIKSKFAQRAPLGCTDAVLLHESDELSFSQVVWGTGLLFHQLDLVYAESFSSLTSWHGLLQRNALPGHHCCETWGRK